MTSKEYLEHFGILGMHWGRKKGKKSSSPKQKSTNSEDYDTKIGLSKKSIKEMSNTELRKLNERMQLERSYKDLTKSEKSAGRKFIEGLILDFAKEQVSNYVKRNAGDLLKKVM